MNVLSASLEWLRPSYWLPSLFSNETSNKVESARLQVDLAAAVKTAEPSESLAKKASTPTSSPVTPSYSPKKGPEDYLSQMKAILPPLGVTKKGEPGYCLTNWKKEKAYDGIRLLKELPKYNGTESEEYKRHKRHLEKVITAYAYAQKLINSKEETRLQEAIDLLSLSQSEGRNLPKLAAKKTTTGTTSPVVPEKKKFSAPELFPLTLECVNNLCLSIDGSLTPIQTAQAAYFVQEYEKIKKPSENLKEAMEMLKVLMLSDEPKKTAQEYTAEITPILARLEKQEAGQLYYNFKHLKKKEQRYNGIRLLKEVQKYNGADGDQCQQSMIRLERVFTTYVKHKIINSKDENRVQEAIALLSFSRSQGSRLPMLEFETQLRDFINASAGEQIAKFPENPQALPSPPVGITNSDGSSCFASSWMQLVANNKLLHDVYAANFPQEGGLVLSKYDEAQRDGKITVDNIGLMRRAINNARGQQDANELANNLHNRLGISNTGKVGNIKLGAKIIEQRENLTTKKRTTLSFSTDRENPYIFPSRQLGFKADESNPSLLSMENSSEAGTSIDGRIETTYKFEEIPEVFVYQFTRLAGGHINQTEVSMPLFHTVEAMDGTTGVMQLQGFIQHLGGPAGGHYVSYILQNGKFWKADDQRISEVSAAEYLVAARYSSAALYATVKKLKSEEKTS